MKKKMMKALKDLNAYIDDDRQKLCDRLHDLELSHKRMEKLLKQIRVFFTVEPPSTSGHCTVRTGKFIDPEDCWLVCDLIDRELHYPYFRVNYKQKGGKNAHKTV